MLYYFRYAILLPGPSPALRPARPGPAQPRIYSCFYCADRVRIVSGSSADRVRMGDGKDISAPAVDLLNENPSLVAFGKIEPFAVAPGKNHVT